MPLAPLYSIREPTSFGDRSKSTAPKRMFFGTASRNLLQDLRK